MRIPQRASSVRPSLGGVNERASKREARFTKRPRARGPQLMDAKRRRGERTPKISCTLDVLEIWMNTMGADWLTDCLTGVWRTTKVNGSLLHPTVNAQSSFFRRMSHRTIDCDVDGRRQCHEGSQCGRPRLWSVGAISRSRFGPQLQVRYPHRAG